MLPRYKLQRVTDYINDNLRDDLNAPRRPESTTREYGDFDLDRPIPWPRPRHVASRLSPARHGPPTRDFPCFRALRAMQLSIAMRSCGCKFYKRLEQERQNNIPFCSQQRFASLTTFQQKNESARLRT
jgi:hypothetical protein